MGALVVAVMLVVAGPALAALPALDRIEVAGDQAPAVRLHLSAMAPAAVHTLPARDDMPGRIYIDLNGVVLGRTLPHLIIGTGPVRRVRSAQYDPTTVRVVLDLERLLPFSMHQADRTITVEIEAPPPKVATTTSPTPPPPAPREPTPSPPARPETPSPKVATAAPPAPPPPPQAPAAPQQARVAAPQARRRNVARPPVPHRPLIVLDAGHGGRDPGAEGVGGVLEKDIVLEVTRLVANRLTARLPVEVLLTRADDSFVSIDRRVAMPGDGAAVFISLHANACTDPSAQGLEVFYGGGGVQPASTPGGSWRAALLGRCLGRALDARVGGVRGEARPGPFGVLLRNPVPSALVEIGYLTHPSEAARARDRRYHELLADAVVDGVAAFLRASAPPL